MSINNIHSSGVGQVYRHSESAPAAAPETQSAGAIDTKALHSLTQEVIYLRGDIAALKDMIVAMNANALGPSPKTNGPEPEARMWEIGMPVSSAEESGKLKAAFAASGGLGRLAFVDSGA